MVATPVRTPAEQTLAARYPAERTSLPGTADVIAIRDAAFGGVDKSGLPHRRVEDWKYTDLRARLKTFPPAAGPGDVARVLIAAPAVEGDKARRLVIANGRYRPELSDLQDLEPGLSIFSLAKALEAGDAAVFAATQMWVSGHSLKHVVAAAAALPLVMALRPRRVGREGTIASLPLRTAKAFNIQRGSAR